MIKVGEKVQFNLSPSYDSKEFKEFDILVMDAMKVYPTNQLGVRHTPYNQTYGSRMGTNWVFLDYSKAKFGFNYCGTDGSVRSRTGVNLSDPDLVRTSVTVRLEVDDGFNVLVPVRYLPQAVKDKDRVRVLLVRPEIWIEEEEKLRKEQEEQKKKAGT